MTVVEISVLTDDGVEPVSSVAHPAAAAAVATSTATINLEFLCMEKR
ncbi:MULTISPECIES: hypothetical protein [unclassified Gordonia (in: high G+C Gram-positive bacteria)]|nr:hypothetical protein [Gordonia sp. ABSL49_1]MCH5642744.1 hypothetical protein [Gordonia sp. ABSL49_1]